MDCTGHLLIEPIKNATFYLHKKFIEVSCSSSIGSSSSYFDYSGNQIFDKKFGAFEYIGATLENRGIAILNDTKEYVIIDDNLNVIKNLCIKNHRDLGESYTIFEHLYGCHFFKGLCTIRKEGKWGMVNSEGNFVLNPNYDFVGAFTDYKSSTKDGFGCAIVGKIINSEMKYGAINSSLKEITRICFDKVGLFEEDIAKVKMNDKWGAINSEGNIVVPIEFNYILDCRDGLIEVGLGDYDSNRFVGHYGLYDKNGKKITKIIYERIGVFHNELAICRMYGKYGLLDKLGNEVIRCYYDGLDYFQNNVYKAKLDDSTFYIDSSGRKFK